MKPSFWIPPPPSAARLLLIVLFVRMSAPLFHTPPPDVALALLPLTVQRSRVSAVRAALKTPPAAKAVFPAIVQSRRNTKPNWFQSAAPTGAEPFWITTSKPFTNAPLLRIAELDAPCSVMPERVTPGCFRYSSSTEKIFSRPTPALPAPLTGERTTWMLPSAAAAAKAAWGTSKELLPITSV